MIFSGVGRLTRDCELKQAGDLTICKFSIACNDNRKKDKTHFFDCVSFGKQGEIINQYFGKGSRIYVFGFLNQDSWKDKEGKTQSRVVLKLDGFEFVDSKKDAAQTVADKFDGEIQNAPSFSDEDIPF